MNYKLKLLDENFKQSNDIQELSDAYLYYRSLNYYLNVMKDTDNNTLFFRLVNLCYTLESDIEETLASKAIKFITDKKTIEKASKEDPLIEEYNSLLSTIREEHFSEERLKNDIGLASSIQSQYSLILTYCIREQNKRLIK